MNSTRLIGTLCLFASVAGVAMAQTNPIYSMNAFGFRKIHVMSNAYQLGAMSYKSFPADVNTVIGPQFTAGSGQSTADNILIWDASNQVYRTLYLIGDVDGTNYDYKWIDNSLDPPDIATVELKPGGGFWVRNRHAENQQALVIGEIANAGTATNRIVPGLQILSYPFSAAIEINQTTLSQGGKADVSIDRADNVMIWDAAASQFINFYLLSDVGDPAYNYKWINMAAGGITTNMLLPGQAFWYRHRGTNSFDWVETRPY